ncbi:MAG TPA: regulatory iron-sulfur-containing complex subunit RicT [Gemmatimonadaceae bacterium]|jgi:cell fate regulator YaaT (PSP1 superfamily)
MSVLIEVAFKGNRKDFFLWDHDDPPPLKAAVIVDADRGEDLGLVYALGDAAELRNKGTPHGYGAAGTSKKARRLATTEDVERSKELREQDDDARRRAQERVKANDLLMKLSDAEWQWDRKKLTLYFTADKRVDFRALVRELASMFRTRIELKQIGVRDEAKRLDGIGRCGRQYCSASWLPELRPVNLGVAKDQRLSLNPSQISGACGRLMCCLRYEHEFYVQSRKRFPKEGKIVRTGKGEEKVIANDIFRERVTLRGDDGELRVLSLAELQSETAGLGAPLTVGQLVAASSFEEEETTFVEERELEPAILDEDVAPVASVELDDEEDDGDEEDDDSVDANASPDAATATAGGEGDKGDRKPHRRRGRRGGRRNRPGNRGPREPEQQSPNDQTNENGEG